MSLSEWSLGSMTRLISTLLFGCGELGIGSSSSSDGSSWRVNCLSRTTRSDWLVDFSSCDLCFFSLSRFRSFFSFFSFFFRERRSSDELAERFRFFGDSLEALLNFHVMLVFFTIFFTSRLFCGFVLFSEIYFRLPKTPKKSRLLRSRFRLEQDLEKEIKNLFYNFKKLKQKSFELFLKIPAFFGGAFGNSVSESSESSPLKIALIVFSLNPSDSSKSSTSSLCSSQRLPISPFSISFFFSASSRLYVLLFWIFPRWTADSNISRRVAYLLLEEPLCVLLQRSENHPQVARVDFFSYFFHASGELVELRANLKKQKNAKKNFQLEKTTPV